MNAVIRQITKLAEKIGRQINLMEVCGTHTVAIFRHGIMSVLPANIRLLSGPGCPVCVTAVSDIDYMVALAAQKDIVLTTFGDMMRVPGSNKSLNDLRAEGADIRIVYSPMDCLRIAQENQNKNVIFFATGFETTSPSIAATLRIADIKKIPNFFIHSVHKSVPPALRVLASDREIGVDGFILPGHVSTIIGARPYRFLSEEYGLASAIAGFGAEDILASILLLLRQIDSEKISVEVQYRGLVKEEGNPRAMEMLNLFFEPCDAEWRGIGVLRASGLALRTEFANRNALLNFRIETEPAGKPSTCRCGDVLLGKILPNECRLFGKACTPEKPVGACMVSTEGSCAAYYNYGVR